MTQCHQMQRLLNGNPSLKPNLPVALQAAYQDGRQNPTLGITPDPIFVRDRGKPLGTDLKVRACLASRIYFASEGKDLIPLMVRPLTLLPLAND